ncbi:hypothetical protein FDP22_22540 (plasmid) [Paroceanicella profunda]|uniref:DUF6285 domain-containing protein n=1 Tax=Paroceanicella profunda TaxID=2579971 RepID=A0A5B8G3T9_9RHOB|nr:DUF6285 domain-containing protein [Paroceanicella profunda]QDL94650.1 hypothetical protein FDP22_22540 [Paroceanicella profunda]
MRDAPGAADLIATALESFRADILPGLDGQGRYRGLMVANALAIALRQIEAGDAPLEAGRARLAAIYPGEVSGPARLAADIRAGTFDPGRPGHAAVAAHLRALARDKAAESAPRALDRPGPET